ncbi:MAG: hypothetical protein ACREN6_06695 [Gemmatimonadaceae bacterium]
MRDVSIMPRQVLLASVLCACTTGLAPRAVRAQTFHGTLRTSASGVPVAGAIVLLVDSLHDVRAKARSDDRGRFDLTTSATELVRLRIQRIGSRPYESLPFAMHSDTSAVISLDQLPALTLPTVTSTAQSACRGRAVAAEANWEVWEDVKTALLATSLTYAEQRSRYRLAQVTRIYDLQPRLRDIALLEDSVAATQPWTSFAPDLLAEHGYVRYADGRLTFVSPDLDVLLSRSFENTHCFEPGLLRDGPLIGLAFDPAARPRGHADIAGVFWIDGTSRELRKLTFNYAGLPRMEGDSVGTSMITFATFDQHEWFISSWTVRSPLPVIVSTREVSVADQLRMFGNMAEGRDNWPVAWELGGVKERHGAVLSVYRAADTLDAKAEWSSPTGSIHVVVRQGAAQSPLAGAEVRLEGSVRQRVTDGAGSAVFDSLTAGYYKISVSSRVNLLLGEEPIVRYVHVDSQAVRPLAVTMQTPYEIGVRRCGPRPRVVAGTVTLNGQPVRDAPVAAHDASESPDYAAGTFKSVVRTDTAGRFVFCATKDVYWGVDVAASMGNGLEASAVAWFSRESPINVVELPLTPQPAERRP